MSVGNEWYSSLNDWHPAASIRSDKTEQSPLFNSPHASEWHALLSLVARVTFTGRHVQLWRRHLRPQTLQTAISSAGIYHTPLHY